jgi:hypothetical protein
VIYFNINGLFHKSQHGFRAGYSCETAMHELISSFKLNQQKQSNNLAMFVDFKKAFDFVNSDLLLVKLKYYGFCSSSLKLINNYFRDRKQMVNYRDMNSTITDIMLGVLHGSILGPLFFLIFINDLIFEYDGGHCALFADDTTLYTSGDKFESCLKKTVIEIDKLKEWCLFNRLLVNWDKTYAMYICSARTRKNENIPDTCVFGLEKVSIVRKCKLLGVMIDDELSFKDHVASICGRVCTCICFLFCIEFPCLFTKLTIIKDQNFCIIVLVVYYGISSEICKFFISG